VSACKTGCGRRQNSETVFCDERDVLWEASPESFHRGLPYPDPRGQVALVDFCNRLRAENNNGCRSDPHPVL
jgi:hypothetical protein